MGLKPGAEQFLTKALGADGFEELCKIELYKLQTNTVLDHEEIRTALQIVPRTILSLLRREMTPMRMDEGKDIQLPVTGNCVLHVTKMSNDVYTGDIREGSKIIAKFRDRSLPGVGLVVMSTFELYEPEDMVTQPKPQSSDDTIRVQRLIDERLGLLSMVREAVDHRLAEREAIDQLIRMRLIQTVISAEKKKSDEEVPAERAPVENIKKSNRPLKSFLDRKSSKKSPEFHVEISKSESVSCPDCGNEIFSKGVYSGCVCYGFDMDNKIYIKKTETGFSMRFPKSWDVENAQMFVNALRQRNAK